MASNLEMWLQTMAIHFDGANLARYTHCKWTYFLVQPDTVGFCAGTCRRGWCALSVTGMLVKNVPPCLISNSSSLFCPEALRNSLDLSHKWSRVSNSLAKSYVSKIWATDRSNWKKQITLHIFLMIKLTVLLTLHHSITISFLMWCQKSSILKSAGVVKKANVQLAKLKIECFPNLVLSGIQPNLALHRYLIFSQEYLRSLLLTTHHVQEVVKSFSF